MRHVPALLLTGIAVLSSACGGNVRSEPAAAAPTAATAGGAELPFDSIEQFEAAAINPDVPYVPTPHETVEEMLRLAQVSRDDIVYDLGSGDGRIVITAAKKYGARGVGIDIDPVRIEEANANALTAGVTDRVRFIQADLFSTDLSEATAVTLYLLRSVNLRLRPKLLAELRPGTPVVSHEFDMGEWKPEMHKRVGEDDVYLWTIPARIDGTWRWTGADGRVRTAKIEQEFQNFKGTATADAERFRIRNGTIKGNEIAFELVRAGDETAAVLEEYSGRFFNGVLQGQLLSGNKRSPWRAEHD